MPDEEKTVEYDLNEVRVGTVDSVVAKLGDLSEAQLGTLIELERSQTNRKGLIAAIEREQAVRRAAGEAPLGSADDRATQDRPSGLAEETASEPARFDGEPRAEAGPDSPSVESLVGQEAANPPAAESDPAAAPWLAPAAPIVPSSGDPITRKGNEARTYSQAEVDAIKGEHATELAKAREEGDERVRPLESEIADLRRQLSSARSASRPAKAVKASEPRKLALTGEAGTDGLRVAFAGDDDMSLPDLPELEFAPSAFSRAPDGRTTLNEPIRFPVGAKRSEVASVWLVDGNGKAAAVSRFVTPLPVGGGSEAEIPKGFLAFTGDVPVAQAA